MAKKSSLQDVFDKNQFDLATAARKSNAWFEQQVMMLSRQRLVPARIIQGVPEQIKTNVLPGHLYMFMYDPKMKEVLPYYDQFPLVFPFRKTPDGFIGLNMHYLPYQLRIRLLDRLQSFRNNDKMDETTKLKYSWAVIDGVSRYNLAKPCVKQYLMEHVRSPFRRVLAEDWATAMMLPVERFTKATKQTVWLDSKRKAR